EFHGAPWDKPQILKPKATESLEVQSSRPQGMSPGNQSALPNFPASLSPVTAEPLPKPPAQQPPLRMGFASPPAAAHPTGSPNPLLGRALPVAPERLPVDQVTPVKSPPIQPAVLP